MLASEKDVYEFFCQNEPLPPIADVLKLFITKYPEYSQCVDVENTGSPKSVNFYRRLLRVYEKVKGYIKNKNKKENKRKLEECEKQDFHLQAKVPRAAESSAGNTEINDRLQQEIIALKQENKELQKKYQDVAREAEESVSEYEEALNQMKIMVKKTEENFDEILVENMSAKGGELDVLRSKLCIIEEEFQLKEQKLLQAEQKVKKYCTKNQGRRENRHKSKIQELKVTNKSLISKAALTEERLNSEIRELTQEKELLESTLENEQLKVAELVRERINLKKNISSIKKKSASKENSQKQKLVEAENEVDKQWLRLKALEKSNADLQQLIDICEGEKLTTLNDGCYTDSIREVVIELLKMNISIRNISPAIQVVIEKLTNRTIDENYLRYRYENWFSYTS